MNPKVLLQISQAQVNFLGKTTFRNLNFTWESGQHWAIIGNSGQELTAFLETIRDTTHLSQGKISRYFAEDYVAKKTSEGSVHSFRDLISYVSQQYKFRNKSNLQNFYFQQRFNSSEADEAASVKEYILENSPAVPGPWNLENVSKLLRLDHLLDSSILKLSNGETRRLALALGLMRQPLLYLMDQPMTGLDAESREAFGDFLKVIISSGIQVLLTTSSHEIPDGITHIANLSNDGITASLERKNYNLNQVQAYALPWDMNLLGYLLKSPEFDAESVVKLENVSIGYGERKILNSVNWVVKPGERWQLKGKNGSGKSTLISLLIGENPQAYSQNFSLFGRKRGTGESIWDVKRPTGFVAPELVRFFPSNQTVKKVIASGLFDTMGLFKKLNPEQESKVNQWLTLFNLQTFSDLSIHRVPLEKQRWAILARALVKGPELLILDEASQGMDEMQRIIFRDTIQAILEKIPITLIYVSHYQEDIPKAVTKTFELS
ncbi:molybdate transport system ATP-binding protein [Algoriphagus boseongensis]|uniref:Molybdate transport system ATP-binding protein n=1 Tax=Algoriphagus boseongensis TaxID=1442587 RepID=A0A4R6T718_9BACT|nr:ATP-binding cassette domain-containing protein [Algoriphagus boseongensis]TDQ18426.1 molybdate transport system ATP-binding protein [Algoriphagus boseongensis]